MSAISIVLLVIALLLGGVAAWGYRTGSLPSKFGTAKRQKEPFRYWLNMVFFCAMALTFAWAAFSGYF